MDLAREKKASDEGSVRMTEADRLLLNSAITSTWHHIRGYLAKGGNPRTVHPGQRSTVLTNALYNKAPFHIIRMLMDHGGNANDEVENSWCAIHLGAMLNLDDRGRLLEALIEGDADINRAGHLMSTPLHLAVSIGSADNVRVLLEHGANANIVSQQLLTPLLNAVNGRKPLKVFQDLIFIGGANLHTQHHERATCHAVARFMTKFDGPTLALLNPHGNNDLTKTPVLFHADLSSSTNVKFLLNISRNLLEEGCLHLDCDREDWKFYETWRRPAKLRTIVKEYRWRFPVEIHNLIAFPGSHKERLVQCAGCGDAKLSNIAAKCATCRQLVCNKCLACGEKHKFHLNVKDNIAHARYVAVVERVMDICRALSTVIDEANDSYELYLICLEMIVGIFQAPMYLGLQLKIRLSVVEHVKMIVKLLLAEEEKLILETAKLICRACELMMRLHCAEANGSILRDLAQIPVLISNGDLCVQSNGKYNSDSCNHSINEKIIVHQGDGRKFNTLETYLNMLLAVDFSVSRIDFGAFLRPFLSSLLSYPLLAPEHWERVCALWYRLERFKPTDDKDWKTKAAGLQILLTTYSGEMNLREQIIQILMLYYVEANDEAIRGFMLKILSSTCNNQF